MVDGSGDSVGWGRDRVLSFKFFREERPASEGGRYNKRKEAHLRRRPPHRDLDVAFDVKIEKNEKENGLDVGMNRGVTGY